MERLGRKLREQRNQKRVAFSAEPDAEASASSAASVSASGGDGSSGSSGFEAALAQDRVHSGSGAGSGGGYFGFKAKLAAVVIAGCLVGGGTYLNLRESSQHAKNIAIMSGTLASGFVFYYFFLKA